MRVLELATGVAGPYAGRLLAMLGAEVVKVEPREGDIARRLPVDDVPLGAGELSPLFVHLNEGKAFAEGAPDVAGFDVVIDSRVRSETAWPGGAAPRLLVSVTAWGFDAAEAGDPRHELVVQAASSLMGTTGEPGRAPLRFPGWQSQYLAGAYAAASALAALRNGGVRHVDIAWVNAVLSGVEGDVAKYLHDVGRGQLQAALQDRAFPAGAFRCADGYVIPGSVRPLDWKLQCELYGRPDLLDDERFDAVHRNQHRDELVAEIQPWFDSHTKAEIFEQALSVGWAAAMVMTGSDALTDPHLGERAFLGPSGVPQRPWLFRSGGSGRRLPSARLPRTAPLRVIELTWAWAGPFVGRFLGAWGADVVRVEAGRYPDGWRTRVRWRDVGSPIPDGVDPNDITWDAAALHNGLNRNKRSVSIDLTTDAGRECFLALLAEADVLVLNMSYHVLADRGVEADVLAAVESRGLVVVNMPALGATGPYRSMPGYGMLMEGMGGFAARYGYADEGARATWTYYPDAVAGVHGAVAALAALDAGGGVVDLSQQETLWLQFGEALVLAAAQGRDVHRMENAEPGCVASGVFQCADGRWVAVVVLDGDRSGQVPPDLAAWAKTVTADVAAKTLQAAGVAASPVLSYADVFESGALTERAMVEEIEHPVTGVRPYLAIPVRVDGEPLRTRRAAAVFAAHTDEVLREWAGFDEARLGALRADGVIGSVPVRSRSPRR